MPRHDASGHLLDAAERLFADHGIASVSDRRVAEVARNSNHSAVRYYFGGREGLVKAMLRRHHQEVAPHRAEFFVASDSLLGDVRALVAPTVRVLSDLPRPTWRARFLAQAYADPEVVQRLSEATDDPYAATEVYQSVLERLDFLPEEVVNGRARLMGPIISRTCAVVEARAATSEVPSQEWVGVEGFLCDAIAGLLQAPVTATSPVP